MKHLLCQVEVKVITQVVIEGVEVSVVDREHTQAQKSTKLVTVFVLKCRFCCREYADCVSK